MTKQSLGRGLSALLSTDEAAADTGPVEEGFQLVAVRSIRANPRQPRARFEPDAIDQLADSIRRVGVLQPLVLRPVEDGHFEVIAGERRLRAATKAGLDHVPAIVKEVSDEQSLEQALIENLHRADLNPLEEAAAFKQLLEDFALSHESLAGRMGRSRAAISNTLRLLGLPGEVQEMLVDGALTAGHARALLAIDDAPTQIRLAHKIIDEDLTVRAAEDLARDVRRAPGAVSGTDRSTGRVGATTHPALLEVGELMGDFLNTQVALSMGSGTGKMVIEFGSLTDLERITQLILGAQE